MQVGLLGAGTVGSHVARLLLEEAQELAQRSGEPLTLGKMLVRDPGRARPLLRGQEARLTTDPWEVLDDPHTQAVAEVMGGLEPARTYVLYALRKGKHVVTANKELLSSVGPELFRTAQEHGALLRFEAAVAAAVPVVGPLQSSLPAEHVRQMAGILNGSTNFLLEAMAQGMGREEALAQARRQGYLEADPRDDLEGRDSARKLAILASLAWGQHVPGEAVPAWGVTEVAAEDVRGLAYLGRELKLLAIAERDQGGLCLSVEPAAVPAWHPLARVQGAGSALWLFGERSGETFLAGSGAGGEATAVAVVSDLMEVARLTREGLRRGQEPWRAFPAPLTVSRRERPYLLRVRLGPPSPFATDLPGEMLLQEAGPDRWLRILATSWEEAYRLRERVLQLHPRPKEVGVPLRQWDPPSQARLFGHGPWSRTYRPKEVERR